jgi:hypothetical protein
VGKGMLCAQSVMAASYRGVRLALLVPVLEHAAVCCDAACAHISRTATSSPYHYQPTRRHTHVVAPLPPNTRPPPHAPPPRHAPPPVSDYQPSTWSRTQGITSLHLAVCQNRTVVIERLMEKGADLDAKDAVRAQPIGAAPTRPHTLPCPPLAHAPWTPFLFSSRPAPTKHTISVSSKPAPSPRGSRHAVDCACTSNATSLHPTTRFPELRT